MRSRYRNAAPSSPSSSATNNAPVKLTSAHQTEILFSRLATKDLGDEAAAKAARGERANATDSVKAVLVQLIASARSGASFEPRRALADYDAAWNVADSLFRSIQAHDAGAVRAAIQYERAGVLLSLDRPTDALAALEVAYTDVATSKRPALELAVRRMLVPMLPGSRASEARDHLDAIAALQTTGGKQKRGGKEFVTDIRTVAAAPQPTLTPSSILDQLIGGVDAASTTAATAPVTLTRRSSRRRMVPRKSSNQGIIAEARVDVSVPTFPKALPARPSRLLLVCSGQRPLLSLPAALLLRRHLDDSAMGVLTIDWAISDQTRTGPVWHTHGLLCTALQSRGWGCTVADHLESKWLNFDKDLRADTLIVPMDEVSARRIDEARRRMRADSDVDGLVVDGLLTRADSFDHLSSATASFAQKYLPSKEEQSALGGAVQAAARAARRAEAAIDRWRAEMAADGYGSVPHGHTSSPDDAHVNLLRLLERGCIQLLRHEKWHVHTGGEGDDGTAEEPPPHRPPSGISPRAPSPQQQIGRSRYAALAHGHPIDDELVELLQSIGLEAHIPMFAEEGISLIDLPKLTDADKTKLRLGKGARQRLSEHLEREEIHNDPMRRLLSRFGLDGPTTTPTLMNALRRAGVTDPLTLWEVRESDMVNAQVPYGARRAVLKAGAATREMAQLLSKAGLSGELLPTLLENGLDAEAMMVASEDELVAKGLPRNAVKRIHRWLDDCEQQIAQRPAHAASPFAVVNARMPYHGGPQSTVEISGDMKVLLELERPMVGAKLEAQLSLHAAKEDPRVARVVCGRC